MRVRVRFVTVALLIALSPGAVQAMDVGTFIAKADGLQKKGMLALFSSDYRLLKGEIEGDMRQIAADARAAKAAGRPKAVCPPGGRATLDSDEILASFRTVPPAQRQRTDVKDALRTYLSHKYPCR